MTKANSPDYLPLYEFRQYYKKYLPILKSNLECLLFIKNQRIQNSVVQFLIPMAIDGLLTKLVLEIADNLKIIKGVLLKNKLTLLKISPEKEEALRRIRNTIVAHRDQVRVSTSKNEDWFKQNYQNESKTMSLILEISSRVIETIDELDTMGIIPSESSSFITIPIKINQNDKNNFIKRLKK